jgi:hypothetical protein
MKAQTSVTVGLVICFLVGVATSRALGAREPSSDQLGQSANHGLAAATTTRRPPEFPSRSSADDRSPIVVGVMVGLAAAGLLLLVLAALPSDVGPERVAALVARRRVDLTLGGAVVLLAAAAIVYVIGD